MATFPGGIKNFTTKKNEPDGDLVDASHINDLQDEVTAIETELLKTSGSVLNHGALAGLSENHHPQYVTKSGNEQITGQKEFTVLPTVPQVPTNNNQVASKHYVDSKFSGGSPYVDLVNNQTVGGKKNFTSHVGLPTSTPGVNDAIRKGYADNAYLGEFDRAFDSERLGGLFASSFITNADIAWQSWTPTLTGWSGTPIVYARYMKSGKTVHFVISISGTSNSSVAEIGLLYQANDIAVSFEWGGLYRYGSNPAYWRVMNNALKIEVFPDLSFSAWGTNTSKIIKLSGFYETLV